VRKLAFISLLILLTAAAEVAQQPLYVYHTILSVNPAVAEVMVYKL
jgi:hypothetical protein